MGQGRRRLAALIALAAVVLLAEGTRELTEVPPPPAQPAEGGECEGPLPALATADALPEPETPWSECAPEAPSMGFDGSVVSTVTGLGIADSEVTLGHGDAVYTTITDQLGHFHFDPEQPGPHEVLAVVANGFWPLRPETRDGALVLIAQPGKTLRDITLLLDPDEPLRAAVVDPDGHAVAGARVLVHRAHHGAHQAGESDAEGVVMLHAPPESVVEARHPRWKSGRTVVDAAARSSGELLVRLGDPGDAEPPPGTIAGWVRDGAGNPVNGAAVVARAEEANAGLAASAGAALPHSAGRAISGADGRFVIASLDAGSYTVTAAPMAAELSPATAEHVRTGRQDVVLILSAGGVVAAFVMPARADSISPFLAQLRVPVGGPPPVATGHDPTPRFQFPGNPPGPSIQRPLPHDGVPVPEIPVPTTDPGKPTPPPAIVPSASSRLVGRVVEAEGGAPVPQARVTLQPSLGNPQGAPAVSTIADQAGFFELGGLPGGTRSAAVYADDHDGQMVSGLGIPAEGTLGPITVVLNATPPGQRGAAGSIGASLIPLRDALRLAHVQPLGGAAEAGLVDGDRVVGVEGNLVVVIGPVAASELVRGPEGTPVRISVTRPAAGNTVELVVFRHRIAADPGP